MKLIEYIINIILYFKLIEYIINIFFNILANFFFLVSYLQNNKYVVHYFLYILNNLYIPHKILLFFFFLTCKLDTVFIISCIILEIIKHSHAIYIYKKKINKENNISKTN